jgi:hypothetical protein
MSPTGRNRTTLVSFITTIAPCHGLYSPSPSTIAPSSSPRRLLVTKRNGINNTISHVKHKKRAPTGERCTPKI